MKRKSKIWGSVAAALAIAGAFLPEEWRPVAASLATVAGAIAAGAAGHEGPGAGAPATTDPEGSGA